uniref:Peroxiredoxin-5 n=1 Tax=Glossina morsitans morsitans TaxID=37546 RepID=A0A1B0FCP1_GLOMM
MFSARLLVWNCSLKASMGRNFQTKFTALAKVGDRLPSVHLFEGSPRNKINIRELTAGQKVIIFGVPGAFTPYTCSMVAHNCKYGIHLPGFVGPAKEFKNALHVHDIICVSVNDPFVMSAWGKRYGADGRVRMLADPSGEFVKAMGLAINLPALGGLRAKRFSMIVVNTIVADMYLEPAGIEFSCSLTQNYMNN